MVGKTSVTLLLCVVFAPAVAAQDDKPVVLQSKAAKEAVADYEKTSAILLSNHQAYHAEALKILVGFLKEAQRKALLANDTDEALRISLRIKEAENDLPAEPKKGPVRGLEIISAHWGAGATWINVTANVRANVRGSQLIMPLVETSLRAPDPARGSFKNLVIVYSVNGKVETAFFNWDSRVQLPR